MMEDRQIAARTPITDMILSPSMRATMTPLLKGGGSPTVRYDRAPMGTRMIAARAPITTGIGDTALRLPTGRSVLSPIAGDRTGMLPPTTLAPAGVFGGRSGGMGAATVPAVSGNALSSTLGGVGSSISNIGSGIMGTVTQYLPLAIKVILAVIVIKIILWMVRGRKR